MYAVLFFCVFFKVPAPTHREFVPTSIMPGAPDAFSGLVNPRWRNGNNRVAPPHAILYTGCRATWMNLGSPGAFVERALVRAFTRPARWILCVPNEGNVAIPSAPMPYAVVAVGADAVGEARVRAAALTHRIGVLVVREHGGNGVARAILDGAPWPEPRLPTNATDTVVPPDYDSMPKIEALLVAVGANVECVHEPPRVEAEQSGRASRQVEKCRLDLASKEIAWRNTLDATPVERDEPKPQAKSSFFLNMLQD